MAAYMDDYTNRRKTRIYVRPSDNENAGKDDLIGQTQAIPIKRGLFDGLSVAQIAAGAAAAATSVALASQIGLAGSIIGAAVSSVVTVVSSQLYRRFLDASAQKLKTASSRMRSDFATDHADADATEVISAAANGRGARVAPSKIRARAAAARAANQRKVIVFSAAVALVAVIACAAAILLGTEGAGLGEKTSPILPTITREQSVDSGTEYVTNGGGTASATDIDDASDDKAANDTSDTTGSTGQTGSSNSEANAGTSGGESTSGTGEGAGEGTGGTTSGDSTSGDSTSGESTPSGDNGSAGNGTTGSDGQGTSSSQTPSQTPADGQTGTAQ